MTKPNEQRWGAVSQALHWLIVLLIFMLAVVGLTMGNLPQPQYLWVYTVHKSAGMAVLVLAALRLIWRLYAGSPKPVPGTPTWQHAIATITHVLLYVAMFAMPLSGWLYESARSSKPYRFFGLFEMPKLIAPNDELRQVAHAAHEWGLYALIVLVLVHAGAALYHHLFLGNATLARMSPRNWIRPSNDTTH